MNAIYPVESISLKKKWKLESNFCFDIKHLINAERRKRRNHVQALILIFI